MLAKRRRFLLSIFHNLVVVLFYYQKGKTLTVYHNLNTESKLKTIDKTKTRLITSLIFMVCYLQYPYYL